MILPIAQLAELVMPSPPASEPPNGAADAEVSGDTGDTNGPGSMDSPDAS
jgi:hypothetical protein